MPVERRRTNDGFIGPMLPRDTHWEKIKSIGHYILEKSVKSHPYVTAISAAGVVGIIGVAALIESGGYRVFPDKKITKSIEIDDVRPVYFEDRGFFKDYNSIKFKLDGVQYTGIDFDPDTYMNWSESSHSGFDGDQFDQWIIKDRKGILSYSRDQIGDGTIVGDAAKEIFEKCDTFANDLKTGIRAELQKGYKERANDAINNIR